MAAGHESERAPTSPMKVEYLVAGMQGMDLNTSPIARQKTLQDEEILELSMKSPGLVKERAQKINKMASEVDLSQKTTNQGHRKRDSRADKGSEDDDTSSVSTLDPRSKEWALKAAKNDYHSLLRLLKEEPKLAGFKDIVTGFTALHWACKHGNSDTVKLVAGTHRVNANVKSHGGYTPLHVAAMFNHKDIMELLVKTYGANANLRDYSGKKPEQYLRDRQSLQTQPASNGQSKPPSSVPGLSLPYTPPRHGHGSLPNTPSPGTTIQSTGSFLRNSLHQSFLRTARPSIRKRLKHKSQT